VLNVAFHLYHGLNRKSQLKNNHSFSRRSCKICRKPILKTEVFSSTPLSWDLR
jgi:hypothetical protein